MISAVMNEAGCDFDALERIGVTIGPGSFTGVRVGVAAARALALAAGVPAVGVTSLEVMACGCVRRLGEVERSDGLAIAHDARRGELYIQHFNSEGKPLSKPQIVALSDLAMNLPPNISLVAGSGAVAVALEARRLGRDLRTALPDLLPEAGDVALIVSERTPDSRPPAPLYLRPPDAKQQTDKSLARAG